MMKRTFGVLVALVCLALLSSCSLLPPGSAIKRTTYDDPQRKSDVEMQKIADAVNSHDESALRMLFSAKARATIPDLDSGLANVLAVFPSGRMTWKRDGSASDGDPATYQKNSEELFALYTVTEDSKKYELYFADFTIHQDDPADNLGIYALGITPYSADPYTASGEKQPFYAWASQYRNFQGKTTGTPGIYIPQQ
jgi:uncharacterized protein DUF5104